MIKYVFVFHVIKSVESTCFRLGRNLVFDKLNMRHKTYLMKSVPLCHRPRPLIGDRGKDKG